MVAPPNGWEIVLRKSRFSMGINYGHIFAVCGPKFTRLCQLTRESRSLQRRFPIVSILFHSRIYSRSKCEVVRNRSKKHVFRPQFFFGGRTPNFEAIVFKIAPIGPFPIMWQSFAAIGRETAEISHWRKRKKERKKERKKKKHQTSAKHKGSRVGVALSKRAALITGIGR